MSDVFPVLQGVALDATDARALAEFYRQLLGYRYRGGDEPPADGEPDPKADDWLVLTDPAGRSRIAFQRVDQLERSTWPVPGIPQQLHLDFGVGSGEELVRQRQRAVALGAELLLDRFDDPEEALYVLADPAGHPFCIFVVPLGPVGDRGTL